MTPADAAFLGELPQWAFAAALLIARVGGVCMLVPGIGEAELPPTIRAGFTLAFAAVLLPVVWPLLPRAPADAWRGFAMVAAEVATGLTLGWLARLPVLALPLAGQIIAGATGLSNIMQPDPMLGPQTAVLSRALCMAAVVAVLATGLHMVPLAALAGSYTVIAAGTFLPAGDAAAQAVTVIGAMFALSLRLSAPFVLAGLMFQVALGLLSRLVPQLQVYFAAMPGQILGGIALFGLLAGTLVTVWLDQVGAALSALPGLTP